MGIEGFDPENKEENSGRAFVERRGLDFGFRVRNREWEKSVCGLSFGFYAFNKTGRLG